MIELKNGTVIVYNDTGIRYVMTGAADDRGYECTDPQGGRHWYKEDFIRERFGTAQAKIKVGNALKNKTSGRHYVVSSFRSGEGVFSTIGYDGVTYIWHIDELCAFDIYNSILDVLPTTPSALDTQHGGDHYKQLGDYQPWQVLKAWLTEEEFRGYMKGTAVERLARERNKGGDLDIQKATHTLHAFLEMKDERL